MLEHRGWLADTDIIDLYAGSGALGIEALSRGARRVIFVEAAPGAARTLARNLAASGFAACGEILATTAERALKVLERRGARVGGVIADPPYAEGAAQRLVDRLADGVVLADGGWLALEHAAGDAPAPRPGLDPVVSRRHGGTVLSLFRRPEACA